MTLVKFNISNSDTTKVYLPSVTNAWIELYTKLPLFKQNMHIKSLEKKYPNRKKDETQGALFDIEAMVPHIKDWNLSDENDVKIPIDQALEILKQLPIDDYMALSDAIYEKKKI